MEEEDDNEDDDEDDDGLESKRDDLQDESCSSFSLSEVHLFALLEKDDPV